MNLYEAALIEKYEAILIEKFELYLEQIKLEIEQNEKLLNRYSKGEIKQQNVLNYFIEKLNEIKND